MRRSHSSRSAQHRQQALRQSNNLPANEGWDLDHSKPTPKAPLPTTKNNNITTSDNPLNARAAAAGRTLLNRPTQSTKTSANYQRKLSEHNEEFSASAAETPLRRTGTDVTLKSCLSSSSSSMLQQQNKSMHSFSRRRTSLTNCFDDVCKYQSRQRGDNADAASSSAIQFVNSMTNNNNTHYSSSTLQQQRKNDEFKPIIMTPPSPPRRNVSFSHLQAREYEVTLGDNPSVSSGVPLSLGWRYNPNETISKFYNDHERDDQEEEEELIIMANNNVDTTQTTTTSSTLIVDFNQSTTSKNNLIYKPRRRRRRRRKLHKLSDRERHRRLSANPHVSSEDIQNVIQSVAKIKLERKKSLEELRVELRGRRGGC